MVGLLQDYSNVRCLLGAWCLNKLFGRVQCCVLLASSYNAHVETAACPQHLQCTTFADSISRPLSNFQRRQYATVDVLTNL